MKMLYLFQYMRPRFLSTASAVRTFRPPDGPTKLEFTTYLAKASRGPHNEAVDARMWVWPHSPPGNAAEQSRLSLAQLHGRVLQRQIRSTRPHYAAVMCNSHAQVIPYPVHGRLGP
jgi:hypothetical protein